MVGNVQSCSCTGSPLAGLAFIPDCLAAWVVLRILFLMQVTVTQSTTNTSLLSPARLRYSPLLSFQFRNISDNMTGDNVLFLLSNSMYLPRLWLISLMSVSGVCWGDTGCIRDCLCHASEKHHGKNLPLSKEADYWKYKTSIKPEEQSSQCLYRPCTSGKSLYVSILRAGKGRGTDTSMFFQTYKINRLHVNLNFGLHIAVL